jgi:hypothetical protein
VWNEDGAAASRGRGWRAVLGEDAVAKLAGLGGIRGAQVHPDAAGGAIRKVFGSVKPPNAVVIPKVVAGVSASLAP